MFDLYEKVFALGFFRTNLAPSSLGLLQNLRKILSIYIYRQTYIYILGWDGFSVYRKKSGFFQKRFFGFDENRKPKNRIKYKKTEEIRKIEGKKPQTPLISNPQIALGSSYTPSSVTAGTNQMCCQCVYSYSGFDLGCISRHVLILNLILVRTKISWMSYFNIEIKIVSIFKYIFKIIFGKFKQFSFVFKFVLACCLRRLVVDWQMTF